MSVKKLIPKHAGTLKLDTIKILKFKFIHSMILKYVK